MLQPGVIWMKLYLMEIGIGEPILVGGSGATPVRALSNYGGVIDAHNPSRHGNSR
jgi:hypothetical protein